jgi:hypothetical protein
MAIDETWSKCAQVTRSVVILKQKQKGTTYQLVENYKIHQLKLSQM